MEIRTSVTHPIYVGWLPRDAPGKAGLTFAPGKAGSSNMGHYCWQRDLTTDLIRLRDADGVSHLVCLIEDHEFEILAITDYLKTAHQLGLEVLRHPIPDGGIPAHPSDVDAIIGSLSATLDAGHHVVIHCRGGLGRAGTVAGCFLVSQGHSVAQARDILHRVRGPNCPENDRQKEFIARYAAWKMKG